MHTRPGGGIGEGRIGRRRRAPIEEGPARRGLHPLEMHGAESDAVSVADRVAEDDDLDSLVLAVQQHRAGLVSATTGTLADRHDPEGTESLRSVGGHLGYLWTVPLICHPSPGGYHRP